VVTQWLGTGELGCRFVLVRPSVVLIPAYVVLHFLGGAEFYFKSPVLLFSTIVFLIGLVSFELVYLPQHSGFGIAGNYISSLYSQFRIKAYKFLCGLGFCYGSLTYLVGVQMGLGMDELRVSKNEIFPPGLSLVVNSLALAGYGMLLFYMAFNLALKKSMGWSGWGFLLLAVVGAALSGARAVVAPYIFFAGIIFYGFGFFSLFAAFVYAVFGLVGLASLKLARLVMSGAEGKIDYYINEGVYDSNNLFISIINILKIHLQDNAWRAHMVFEYIPERMDFQYGKSMFFDFYSILPGEQVNPHVFLSWNVMYGAAEARGYPPTLLGQGWLDFGYFGVFLYSIFYILTSCYLYKRSVRSGKIDRMMLYFMFIFCMVLALYGAVSWLAYLLFFVCIYFFSRIKV